MSRQPWLVSVEAQEQRAAIRAENLGRIRGHELAEMRKSAGLAQAEVAAGLGVSQARISQIEHGQVRASSSQQGNVYSRAPWRSSGWG